MGVAAAERGFVGRHDELAAVAAWAKAASEGRAGVVWIEGDAGTGKTSFLRAALASLPEGFQVLRAQADELAADLPFELVSQLGVSNATAAFAAGLDILDRWGRMQAAGPVAIAVEDLHWADTESRLALLTAARRLGADRALVLVTSRLEPVVDDGWQRLRTGSERCLRVGLGPLSEAEVAEVARRGGVVLSPLAARRLFRHTAGHPLYLCTLLSEVPAARLAANQGALPVPRSLASATNARLAELPRPARELTAALAVVNQRSPLLTLARVAGVSEAARALDDLLSTGFVSCEVDEEETTIEFAHPLYRAAVYGDLAPSRRQRLHRAAAEVLGGQAALGHRVAAADGVDDALAQEADRAAQVEADRGHFAVAARTQLWASQLSSQLPQAESHLLWAASLLIDARQVAQVVSLRPRLEACGPGPERSYVLGCLAWAQGDIESTEELCTDAARYADRDWPGGGTPLGTEAVPGALLLLALVYGTTVRPLQAVEAATKVLALAPKAPDWERAASVARAFGETLLRGAPAGLELLAARLPADPEAVAGADVDLLVTRGTLGLYAGLLSSPLADLRAVVRHARRHPCVLLSRSHVHLGQLLFGTGEWDEALVHAHIALSLLAEEQRSWVEAHAHEVIGCVLASRGEWAAADDHLVAARQAADELGTAEAEMTSRTGRAAWARARNEPGGVVAELGPIAGIGNQGGVPTLAGLTQARRVGVGIRWWPVLIEALISLGEVDLAAAQLAEMREVVAHRGLGFGARLMGVAAQLSAAVGQPERAVSEFRRAIELVGPDDALLDRALVHHGFGRLLVARGERRAGVDQLRTAHKLLVGVGAKPYAERARADLDAAGIPVPARGGSPLDLTERESDVVALVTKGLTNAEVATALYVSANTVDYHLRNVYAKLGISSRRELRRLAVAGAPVPARR